MTTTARIRAKGLDGTGVTETVAQKSYGNLGSYLVGVVELRADTRRDNLDGDHAVDYIITGLEVATDQIAEDHLRSLTQALHTNRVLASEDEQLQIDTQDDIAPKVGDVIAQGRGLLGGDDDADDDMPTGQEWGDTDRD